MPSGKAFKTSGKTCQSASRRPDFWRGLEHQPSAPACTLGDPIIARCFCRTRFLFFRGCDCTARVGFAGQNQRAKLPLPPSPAKTKARALRARRAAALGLESAASAGVEAGGVPPPPGHSRMRDPGRISKLPTSQSKSSRTRIPGFKKCESPRQEAFPLNVRLMVRLAHLF